MADSQSQKKTENPDDPEEVDAENLINEVQLHDVIYNKQNKSHSRNTAVEAAWVEIARALCSTPQQCQKKWANLRRCFRDAIAKENLPSGAGATRGRKKFPFMAQMEFLRQHVTKKATTVSNFDVEPKLPVPESDSGPYCGEKEDAPYTGNSLSTLFSGYADVEENAKKDDIGPKIDYEFLKQLSPVTPRLTGEEKPNESDESDASENAKLVATEGNLDKRQNRVKAPLRKPSNEEDSSEPYLPKVSRKRKYHKRQTYDSDIMEVPELAITEAQHDQSQNPGYQVKASTRKVIEEKHDGRTQPKAPRNRKKQEHQTTKQNKRSSSESVHPISSRKKVQRKRAKRQNANVSAKSETDDETTMFRTITDAAVSISNRNKNRGGDVDGIVKGFVKMQKHMLMKINEDARYAYIKEATCKLTELCEREKFIL